jgi:hypothetical protein
MSMHTAEGKKERKKGKKTTTKQGNGKRTHVLVITNLFDFFCLPSHLTTSSAHVLHACAHNLQYSIC